jgi:probable phosphoglycerate mutase
MGTLDVPLNEAGREQCERTAAALSGLGVERIVSSPLARATETARIFSSVLRLDVSFDDDLQEVRFGRWQGSSYDDVRHDPEFQRFMADPVTNATPGGETIVDVQRRGLAAFARAAAGERTLFISHGDIIRATLCQYLAIPIAEFRRMRIDNCSLSAVAFDDARVEVKFVNLLADPERAWDPIHWTRPK